ncbi:GNAT family N-acetyltransferase [Thalassobium sp. R2A62]|jgi:RimJ/RimL family protein N-acetyltransferase|uniref:GNAT family N-acetyltransferase n=1 Tax=Thalassobium sp. R2A62 TaxID=633131 RepID=UPI0001B1CE86|nr:GNAT family N-acetyltransferase [Thalassobium sp. R2A62]EET47851.1 acetyltransferase, gnat family [Thalassobium sp. R2A62]MDG1340435.1 GNAT family N-acetyltransferase [Paracoccaceae bacterium]MDG2452078.1 GNAT family N-acetyltransferase [Paracoccaceae bacterium]
MTTTLTIPTLKTERLTLRAPRITDFDVFDAFMASERTKYVGGPYTTERARARAFGHAAGMWMLRGYGNFVMCLDDDAPLGMLGPWHPLEWPEAEFGWALWDPAAEGHGYVTEAMRTIIPWGFEAMGIETAVSYVDAPNTASAAVAKRLGATFDPVATQALNADGAFFHDPDGHEVQVWRHQEGALV